MAEVTIVDALGTRCITASPAFADHLSDNIRSSAAKTRKVGLQDLHHIVRHNRNTISYRLKDDDFLEIFEALFKMAYDGQPTFINAKTTATRTSAANRLSDVAMGLRQTVEVSVRTLKARTVKTVLGHIMDHMFMKNGDLCDALALDYARTMREIFSYQPHVEQLIASEWGRLAEFCTGFLKKAHEEVTEVDGADEEHFASTGGTANGLSHRSSRSTYRESGGSQGYRPITRAVAEEMVACLRLLTAAPNAPKEDSTTDRVWTIINVLKTSAISFKAHSNAFGTLNNILCWTRTEGTRATQKASSQLLRLVKQFWSSKLEAAAGQMLITVLLLRPYISQAMKGPGAAALHSELSGLLRTLEHEYTNRLEKDRNTLGLEDLRLEINRGPLSKGQVGTALFTLRCTGAKGEMNWLLINILAFIKIALINAEQQHPVSDGDSDGVDNDIDRRPRKRLRLEDQLTSLLDATSRGTPRERICALQTMTFVAQQKQLSNQQLLKIADCLALSCSDDNVNICSWAFLATASCAAQSSASDTKLSDAWSSLWQLGARSLGNSSTCRAAAYGLSIMLASRLVGQSQSSELVHVITHTMDLGGPDQLSDSAALLLSIMMRMSQQLNPATATAAADSIIGWLSTTFKPSKIEDKQHTSISATYEAADIISLTATCLGQATHSLVAQGPPVWDAPARAWLFCEDHEAAVSYLLLNSPPDHILSDVLASYPLTSLASGQHSRTSTEALVLNYFISELTRCKDAWQNRTRPPSSDAFAMLCKAYAVSTCVVECTSLKDVRRQTQLQELVLELSKLLTTFVGSNRCETDIFDSFISVLSGACSGLPARDCTEPQVRSPCELTVCRTIRDGVIRRHNADDAGFDDDDMDFDGPSESQHSRGSAVTSSFVDIATDEDVSYSKTALTQNAHLYAVAALALEAHQNHVGNAEQPSSIVMDYLLSLSDNELLSCRDMVIALPNMGLMFSADDTDRILAYLMEKLMRKYAYKTSEASLGFVLDLMQGLVTVWADDTQEALFDLGLDTYEWFTENALSDNFFSPSVQQRLARLLLHLCQLKPEYGRGTKAGTPRTCCFKLLSKLPIAVQYQLSDRIPTLFGKLVLSEHDKMFDDLQDNMIANPECPEMMAIRMLHLSKLGARWSSLLRPCTWYIFDLAGRAPDCAPYARQCIEQLAASLKLGSPRELFSLFASQLLFTWMDKGNSIADLPWETFHFTSLHELLKLHRSEITAQLVLRQDQAGLELVQKAIKKMPRDVIKDTYAKCVAYCMSQDVVVTGTSKQPNTVLEKGLRQQLGDDEHKRLLREQLPIIAGYMLLATEQTAKLDTWLAKHDGYQYAAATLKSMMRYTRKEDELPEALEPYFEGSFLIDQLARLARRAGKDQHGLWDASSFVLTARMLLNAVDLSLGSLQCCRMIRRVMILVALSREVALDGYSPEMLVHSLRPFLNDGVCANDTIGLLQFIFDAGRQYLGTALRFTTGAIVLVVLQMRKHSRERHDSTTQESQHSGTVQVMAEFQTWLVQYLAELTTGTKNPAYMTLTQALGQLQLPGNANAQSAESSLLLFLLDQWAAERPLCSKEDIIEALQILSEDFAVPSTPSDDCLGNDTAAVQYSQPIWETLQSTALHDSFITWAAIVLGRAYAATGVRSVPGSSKSLSSSAADADAALLGSQHTIVSRVASLIWSRDRTHAGLAEYTLRKMQDAFSRVSGPDTVLEFTNMVPDEIYAAIYAGSYGYEPTAAVLPRAIGKGDGGALQQVLAVTKSEPLEAWATILAVTLCSCASKDAILSSLAPLFHNVRGLAVELLPQMLHVLLATGHTEVSSLLAEATDRHLSAEDLALVPKQRFFLRLLLYLRSQQYPGETTRVDRLKWLEIDYMNAAQAAARCAMPTAGLLLAECTSAPAVQESRRTSKRASLSQEPGPAQVPPSLLLAVYKQMEEPDSFYGVSQEASLGSVLERLDHEGDGFRSMMFRSAQLDSQMRRTHHLAEHDAVGMAQALSSLSFNSLAFALMSQGLGNSAECKDQMLKTAQSLQQWDITPSEEHSEQSISFGLLQELSRSSEVSQIHDKSRAAILESVKSGIVSGRSDVPSHGWYSNLATLTELSEVVAAVDDSDLATRWNVFTDRHEWMHMAKYEDTKPFLSARQTLFSVLGQNVPLQRSMHVTLKQCRTLEVEALLAFSRISREHSKLQEALTATTTMDDMVTTCKDIGLRIDSAVKLETASVLWDAGESSMSVKLLVELSQQEAGLSKQDIPVGRAGLLAQLGHESAEARLAKPEQILSQYLKPAIQVARQSKDRSEIGRVHYEFATFCDHELQNPSTIESLARLTKMRQAKEEEIVAYKQAMRSGSKKLSHDEAHIMNKNLRDAQNWLKIDTAEEKRLLRSRSDHVNLSLQNYLQALQASDEHDICVLRFFALWLENTDNADEGSDAAVKEYLPKVPSWKFVRLMNQLMSRLDNSGTSFQAALADLLRRIFEEHPYHSLHHLYATKHGRESKDLATRSRYDAAKTISDKLLSGQNESAARVVNFFKADFRYKELADVKKEELPNHNGKLDVSQIPKARAVREKIPELKVPPATITLPLNPSCVYRDVPHIVEFDQTVSIMTGLSAPKMMKLRASDGKWYKELYKSGDDDLRQDAIMEQVFEEVSKMLRNHKATRQRDLKLRTYKVIPLSSGSGIIEFVPNSIPINEFLMVAHKKYYPKDVSPSRAREAVGKAAAASTSERLHVFQKVCEKLHPVMRHFFLERFNDPDEWFAKRTAYSRTTASISIMGHIIGLGDRHCSNILLDEQTGEIVHIDLGVAFEAGRVLPIPELVPFRLTRDIIDGMGATGVEGVFRRCCEFTLDAVREDKDSIMTLLNVLRYDPLHNWTISPLRAKRMQEAQSEMSRTGGGAEENSSRRKEQEAGEADRALSVVEKKLSKTLSTAAAVNELIQAATDETHLATLFGGWAAWF